MKVYVFDAEANGLLDDVTKIHCATFVDLEGNIAAVFTPDNIQDVVKFMDEADVLIGHNCIGYDFPLFEKILGYKYKGTVVDTLIMSRLLNPKRLLPPNAKDRSAGPHSVYAWGVRVGHDKPDHEDWENYSEAMLHRNKEDAAIQLKIYYELLKEAKGKNWKNAFRLTFRLFENLHKQEQYGWYFDKKKAESNIKQLDRWMLLIEQAITPRLPNIVEPLETKEKGEYKYVKKPFLKSGEYAKATADYINDCGMDINSRPIVGAYSRINIRKVDIESRSELIPYLLGLGWEPKEWNFNSEGERTSPKLSKDDPFEGVSDRVGALVAKRMQCKHRKSSVMGLIALVRSDGAVAASVANLAVTGRATHRGVVNIPKVGAFFGKQMRAMFSSRPGMVLVGCDSAGNQLRQLAARMEDPEFISAVVDGDPHTVNKEAAGLETRDQAKTFIYGFLFGAGDAKIGKIIGGSAAEGAVLKERYFKRFPNLETLINKLKAEWRASAKKTYNHKFRKFEYSDGCITGLDGRPIKVPYEHQLLVYLLQSDEAIHMAAAYNMMCAKLSKCYKWGEDFGVVCWYHDEYTIECRPEISEHVAEIAAWAIKAAGEFLNIKCPHAGDPKIGRNWSEIH